MSLREEIKREFAVYLAELNNGIEKDDAEQTIDNHVESIVSEFEKRINEKIEYWSDEKRCCQAKKMFVQKAKIRGRIEAYKNIKKEMLK